MALIKTICSEPHRYILKMLGLDIPSSSLDKEACSSDDDNYKKPTIKVAQDDFERIKIISQGACKIFLLDTSYPHCPYSN